MTIFMASHRFYDSRGKAIIISELKDVGRSQKLYKNIENNEREKSRRIFIEQKVQERKINSIAGKKTSWEFESFE